MITIRHYTFSMKSFFIGVHSDASIKSFPDNRSGSFKTLLSTEVDLGNVEYDVAVASVSRYYETTLNNLVFLREKRQAVASPGLTLTPAYPIGDVSNIQKNFDDYFPTSDPSITYSAKGNEKYYLKFKVGRQESHLVIYQNPLLKSEVAKQLKSTVLNTAHFELTDMLNVGLLTFACTKNDADKNDF